LIQKKHSYIILLFAIFFVITTTTVFGVDQPIVAKNIEFVNADLRDVFRSLAEAGKFNVIMEPVVHGEVSLTLKYGVTLKDAVSVIAKTYGYSCRWLPDSPTAVVGNANFIKLNFDRKISKVFQLTFADAKEVAESIEVVIPKNRIKADHSTNQITVMANDSEITNIAEIIARLDCDLPKISVEAKLEEVNAQLWKEIGIDNAFSPPHMGANVLTEQQCKKIDENPQLNILTKPNLTGLDNHEAKIFLGDKVPLITEKNKQGDINYKVEYVDAGTSLAITPRINANNQVTLMVKVTVSTIANKSKPKPGSTWVPWVVTREFESTIRLELGQSLLLSGLLQRNEYKMMKGSPFQFPVLSELFAKENSNLQTVPDAQNEVILVLTPKLLGPIAGENPAAAPQVPVETPDTKNLSDSAAGANGNAGGIPPEQNPVSEADKLPLDEEKPEVRFTPIKSDQNGPAIVGNESNANSKYKEIRYLIKKGDSLSSIVKKFASDLQMVAANNHLGKTGIIKMNTTLLIPVPVERFYTLKPKETLWRIAKRYGVTLAALKDLNGISDETKVKAGQELVLPSPAAKIVHPQF
jgi:LysM repeat protein